MLVDAHCHLERATYGDEVDAVIERARRAGVGGLVAVGAGGITEGAREAVALAGRYAGIWAAVGIHPHDIHLANERDFAAIAELLAAPKVVALGEVGLDYHYDRATGELQRAALARFCRLAEVHRQPLMLHVRDAYPDALKVLDDAGVPAAGAMVHCFTGGPAEAEAYLARGLMLSIPGVVTFRNAAPLREAVPLIPADRLLLETDSPYLAPVPHRGRRNEPALVAVTAAFVATLRGTSAEALAAQTTANARAFFGLPAGEQLTAPAAAG